MRTGIYQILNKINGKSYIGSAVNFIKRYGSHRWQLNNNRHGNIHLQRAFNKYGADAFEFIVLEYCQKEKLLEREQFWLYYLKPSYNVRPIAGNQLGFKHRPESILKMKSVIYTDERKLNMSKGRKNRKHSEETKVKLKEASKNKTCAHFKKLDRWPHGSRCKCVDCKKLRCADNRAIYHKNKDLLWNVKIINEEVINHG